MVMLQLQLDWGWTPALAAIGMLPQVIVLVAGGAFVTPFVQRVGLERAAWLSAAAVVLGLAVYGLLGSFGYVWVAIALVVAAAGMRVVGVVAGTNVIRGLPTNRTTMGAGLTDTAGEVASGVGIAITGTILAALFTGDVATTNWTTQQPRSSGRRSRSRASLSQLWRHHSSAGGSSTPGAARTARPLRPSTIRRIDQLEHAGPPAAHAAIWQRADNASVVRMG
jgi:hypothetical protein